MTELPIRVFRPVLPTSDKISVYLDRATRSGQFSNGGPLVQEFEARLGDHFGVAPANVVVCSSGTMALEAALATKEHAEAWDLPAWTFTATPGSVLRAGKLARFVDVNRDHRAVFDSDARFAIDVLPFGVGPDWTRFSAASKAVLVDAAASFDACEEFPFPDSLSVGVMVSLHATKSMPAGEGGVFFSNDADWVAAVRRWTNFGMWGSRVSQIAGTNGKMSEFTASVGLASLDAWPATRERWRALAEEASAISTDLGISDGGASRGLATPYWNVRLEDEAARAGLETHLAEHGVETRRWWGDGCHTMPAYLDIPRGELPQTDAHARAVLGLPFHLGLRSREFARIAELVGQYLESNA